MRRWTVFQRVGRWMAERRPKRGTLTQTNRHGIGLFADQLGRLHPVLKSMGKCSIHELFGIVWNQFPGNCDRTMP